MYQIWADVYVARSATGRHALYADQMIHSQAFDVVLTHVTTSNIDKLAHIWNFLKLDWGLPRTVLYSSFSPKLMTGTREAPVCSATRTKPVRRCNTRSIVPGVEYKLSVAPPMAIMIDWPLPLHDRTLTMLMLATENKCFANHTIFGKLDCQIHQASHDSV